MMRALYTGTSGIKGHQTRMDVVGNNISNVNTVGYKSGRTTFADMLSQKMQDASSANGNTGSTNPKQVGLGTNVGSIDLIFQDGAPMITGKKTDLCLSGDGLFVVRGGNETYYTRDGAFDFDAEGNFVLPGSGHFVQGWMASEGVIDTTGGIVDIKIPLVKDPVNVNFGGKEFHISGIPDNGKKWTFKDNVPLGATTAGIVDQDGNNATVSLSPASTFEIAKGTDVYFQTYDILTKGSVTAQYPLDIIINGKTYKAISMDNDRYKSDWVLKAGGAVAGSNTITMTDGTNDITFTLDSPLEESISSGGTLKDIQIDSNGIITGEYTDGTRRTEAQVALAHFSNSAGLSKTGTSLYQESANSGTSVTIKAGEYGVVLTPGALEMSNVSIASEFADMIVTQRGFQSNAKIVTVGDEMIETAVNMKR